MPCGIEDSHFIIIFGVMIGLGIMGWLAYITKVKQFKRHKRFPRKSTDWNGGYRKGEKNDYHMQGYQ